MHKITSVSPIKEFKIKIKFIDVSVDNENNTVFRPGGIDLCPDALYAEVTGKSIDSVLKSGTGV